MGAEKKKITFPTRDNPAYKPASVGLKKCLTNIISAFIRELIPIRTIAAGVPYENSVLICKL